MARVRVSVRIRVTSTVWMLIPVLPVHSGTRWMPALEKTGRTDSGTQTLNRARLYSCAL